MGQEAALDPISGGRAFDNRGVDPDLASFEAGPATVE
jgi:hypothetical protein